LGSEENDSARGAAPLGSSGADEDHFILVGVECQCRGLGSSDRSRPMRKSITRIFSRRQKRADKKEKRSSSVEPPSNRLMSADDVSHHPPRSASSQSEKFEIESIALHPPKESPTSRKPLLPGGKNQMPEDVANTRPRENTPPRIVVPTRLADDDDGDEIEDTIQMMKSYDAVPPLEETKLPRGGVSIETKALGRIQVRSNITNIAWRSTLYNAL
jgi:hypothetical protein